MAVASAALSCRGANPRGAGPPQQVILLTIDTLRADHLGCYGMASAETPALDALARESIVFDDASAPAPITVVSHATILTGLSPPAHGMRANGSFRLPRQVETLAETLKGRGFETAAFVGSFVLHHEVGLDQGFDTYDDALPRRDAGRRFDYDERRAEDVLTPAADWASARRASRFFLWAHVFDPHAPYEPPPPYDTTYSDRPYDGEIAYVDAEIGRFLGKLRESGVLDRAVVIVTADHGEGLGEHGEQTHGLFLYQSTIRVPLIVRPPGGARPPARVPEAVGLIDLAPSVLASLGTSGPEMEGRVLPGLPWSLPTGEDGDRTAGPQGGYYFESLLPYYSFGWAGTRGYRSGSRKVVRSVGAELYDLAKDPNEREDLADAEASTIAALTIRIEEVTRAAESKAAAGAENLDLSAEDRERLLSLGYVAGVRSGRKPVWGHGPDPRRMVPFFERFDRAKKLLATGQAGEGIALLEALADDGPPSVAVLAVLGQARMERGEFDAAAKLFLRARAIDPGDYDVERRLAEAHFAMGHLAPALEAAREALRLNDRNAESRSVLGATLARLGRHDEAIATFREALRHRPSEPALHFNLGLALESASRAAEAETAYADTIALDPHSNQARVALARLLIKRGALDQARGQLEAALRSEPDDREAVEQLGITLAQSGDTEGALAQFQRMIRIDPDRPEGYYDKGIVLARLNRKSEATAAFKEFLARWTGDPAKARAAREHLDRLGS